MTSSVGRKNKMVDASVSILSSGQCHALYRACAPYRLCMYFKMTVVGDIAPHFIVLALAVLFFSQFSPLFGFVCCF